MVMVMERDDGKEQSELREDGDEDQGESRL